MVKARIDPWLRPGIFRPIIVDLFMDHGIR